MKMNIVLITGIKSYAKETSEEYEDYIRIYNFEYDAFTICKLTDGTILQNRDVLFGARLGKYECRIKKGMSKATISEFHKDLSQMCVAFGGISLAILICFNIADN